MQFDGGHRWRLRRVMVVVVALSGLSLVGSPSATSVGSRAEPAKPEVTLSAPARAEVGTSFTVRATVKRGAAGQKLTLQRRSGGAWQAVADATLPSAGATKKVSFKVKSAVEGTQIYRAVLAKKKTSKKTTPAATSPSVRVVIFTADIPPVEDPAVTFTSSTSTTNEQTKVTFSGTVTDAPDGTQVHVQFSRGKITASTVWTTATTVATTGSSPSLDYSGTVTVPVLRDASTNGAPQLNLRAVAAGAVSASRSILVRTRFDGTYAEYDANDEIVGQDTFQVIYSDKRWYMNFGTNQASGSTDGWDLVQANGLRFEATYHDPTPGCTPGQTFPSCVGNGYPYLDYTATFGTADGEHRIEGTAYFN